MAIWNTANSNKVALLDSVSGFAFGPTFDDADTADAYLNFVQCTDKGHFWRDARSMSDAQHEQALREFIQAGYLK